MHDTIQRLEFDQMTPELQAMLKPTVDRLGYFGETFQVLAHVPKGLQAFMQYTAAVKDPLPFNLNEVCALTVCSRLEADYELIQHERLSLKTGMSREWIGELTGALRPTTSVLNDEERKVRDLAAAMAERGGKDCAAELSAVAAAIGDEQAVAAVLQITRFISISALVHVLGATLPVPSIFEDAADAPGS